MQNDPFCVDELFKHICLYKKNKLKEEKEKEDEGNDSPATKKRKSILKVDGSNLLEESK